MVTWSRRCCSRVDPGGWLREPPSQDRNGDRAAATAGGAVAAAARDPAAAARVTGTGRRAAADQSCQATASQSGAPGDDRAQDRCAKGRSPGAADGACNARAATAGKAQSGLAARRRGRRKRYPPADRARAPGFESRELRGSVRGYEGPVRSGEPISRSVGAEPQGTQSAVCVDTRGQGRRDCGDVDETLNRATSSERRAL